MKPALAACLLALAALPLAACGKSNEGAILTYAAGYTPPPVEGVYPDCNFGVVAPDQGGPARCAKPATN